MDFDFTTAPRILFGVGKIEQLKSLVSRPDFSKCLLLTGGFFPANAKIKNTLDAIGISHIDATIHGEPSVEDVDRIAQEARETACDFVIAMGGGSTMDAGKAAAALIRNPGDPKKYLEVVGQGLPLVNPSVPVIAIPTTAGTGSEVTRNAVLSVKDPGLKVSLRSPYMIPQVALVDPGLTVSLPPEITAATGMDALAQVVEPYVSLRANPITDGFCREGIMRISRSLVKAFTNGSDLTARVDMSFGSLLGGMALANAGLGAVHGFASVIGGMYKAPHGAICARLLPFVTQMNIECMENRDPHNSALSRYDEMSQLATGHPTSRRQLLVEWLKDLLGLIKIPGLSNWAIKGVDIDQIATWSLKANSMKTNPIALTLEECRKILTLAL